MRKLIVALCIVAMMLTMAVPALANESIVEAEVELSNDSNAKVEVIKAAAIASVVEDFIKADENATEAEKAEIAEKAETITKILERVASTKEEDKIVPADVVNALAESGEKSEKLDQVKGYAFSTQFSKITGTKNDLTSVKIEKATKDTKFLWIGPDGEIQIIEPNEDGTYTFPGEGLIAQIDPAE